MILCILLSTLLKNSSDLLFFQLSGISPECHGFLNVMESGLPATSTATSGPWDVSHEATETCHQVILNLLFTYTVRDSAPSTFPWRFEMPTDGQSLTVSGMRWRTHWMPQTSPYVLSIILPAPQWGYILLGLYLLIKSLLAVLSSLVLCYFICLGFPDPSLHNETISLYPTKVTGILLCICKGSFTMNRRIPLWGTKSFALRDPEVTSVS